MTNTALSAKIEQVQFAEQIAQNVTDSKTEFSHSARSKISKKY